MATYKIKLKRREVVAEGTVAVYFEKPEGFQFKAGQFLRFTAIDPPETDDEGNSRTFSIASAPHEEDLMIATRMRDTAFKRVINTMPPGSEIEIKGPFGKMTLHDDPSRPAVCLTGGIGITPFRSIALDAAHARLAHPIHLFYSNRRREDAAFFDQLAELEKINPRYQFIPTITSAAASTLSWTGETGYITGEMLARFIDDLKAPVYYIAGPEGLVTAMRKTLGEAEVNESDVRVEQFTGY